MMAFLVVSDVLLYLAVSLLAGVVVLQFVPKHRKPVIVITNRFIGLSIASIPIFTAAPVLQLTFLLMENGGFSESLNLVLTGFRIGQSFLISLIVSFLWLLMLQAKSSKFIQLIMFFLTIVNIGYGSHSSAVSFWPGLLSHSVHVLTISLWAGVLLLIACFSPALTNWGKFLKWFTPFAFGLMAVILISGLAVMVLFSAPTDYANSWALPYGQMLLLKHLAILPLLAAAFLNGFANKKKEPSKSLLRLEVFMLLLIFVFTALMSKLAPPHDINQTFITEGSAPFLDVLSDSPVLPINAQLEFSLNGVLLVTIGILCFGLMMLGIQRKSSKWFGFICAFSFVVFVYAGTMMNIAF